jgi:hypothetical protein
MSVNSSLLRVFIGYDEREIVAFHTLSQSLIDSSSVPLSIFPLVSRTLENVFQREHDPLQSNAFTYTRFLVPYLCDYSGHAIYMDCDMLALEDFSQLKKFMNEKDLAVFVVKHDYTPKLNVKYLSSKQHAYPRKNWSSFILWNCDHPKNKILTPDFVANASAKTLHRFLWLEDSEIGELNVTWNWLVGEYQKPEHPLKNVHWTNGGPYFNEFSGEEFSEEWRLALERVNHAEQNGK